MPDFSSITSLRLAEEAVANQQLVRALLLPAELGGQDVPENIAFIPKRANEMKDGSTADLLSAVNTGLTEISVIPEYRGASFVPVRITVSAGLEGEPPAYELEIAIW